MKIFDRLLLELLRLRISRNEHLFGRALVLIHRQARVASINAHQKLRSAEAAMAFQNLCARTPGRFEHYYRN